MPIRLRLALVSGLLIAAGLVAFGSFLHVRLGADLLTAVDAGLRSRAQALVEGLGSGGPLGGSGLIERDEAFGQLLDRSGTILESSSGLVEPLLSTQEARSVEAAMFESRTVATTEEAVPARLLAVPAPDDLVLVVGASLEDQNDALDSLRGLLVVAGPAAAVLAVVVGWVVAGVALRPVETLRIEAEAISASDSERRLKVPGTGDELARLGASLNRMLERLDAGMRRERRFVADASHELRTPLANLRAELELALGRARTQEELTMALRSAAEETERLSRLAEDLLVLARAADGSLPMHRTPADMNALLEESADSFQGRAASVGVRLTVVAPTPVQAAVDATRIRQAVGNLLDNAIRHSPEGGTVEVSLRRRGSVLDITVADRGPGLTEDFLKRMGQPFSREDATRSRSAGGTGLGLAIVRVIAGLHGGGLRAANRTGGGAELTLTIAA
jgi:heavy metal sensor kinase